jgi:hypothetical protein
LACLYFCYCSWSKSNISNFDLIFWVFCLNQIKTRIYSLLIN